jgi:protein-glutamine gamma-glutamyltransferase
MRTPLRLQVGITFLALVNMIPTVEAGESWLLFGVALTSAIVALVLRLPDGGNRMPSTVLLLGVIAAVCMSSFEMMRPETVYIVDLAQFIILLACCKFFELRTHRDMGLVLLISFLLLVIGAFVSASPSFGVVLTIDATLGIAWYMRFQVDRERGLVHARQQRALEFGQFAASIRPIEPDAQAPNMTWRPALASAFILCTIAAATFIAVPRGWGRGIFGRIQNVVPVAVTAFTEEMTLRDARIIEDPTLVMRARFLRNGKFFGGDEFQPYLRGATHDKYRDGRWRRTRTASLSDVVTRRDDSWRLLPHAPGPIRGEHVIETDIWLENVTQGALFSIYPPISVASKDLRNVQQRQTDLTISTEDPTRGAVSYRLTSVMPNTQDFSRVPDAPPPLRDWSGGFSRIHPAIKQFSREHFRQFGDFRDPTQHRQIANRVREYLQTGDYEYSLDRGVSPEDSDRMKDFIFDNRQGHCEYFATAMALMLQSMDIPARTVNGFYGGEYNPVGGYYQFRAKDAHAWVEVFLPPAGWVVFDASPPSSSRETERDDGMMAKLHRLSDFARFKWATSVVSFDTSSREELLASVEHWLRIFAEIRHRPGSFMESIMALLWGPEMIPLWQRVCYWLLLVLFVAFAVLLVRLLWIGSRILQELLPGRSRSGQSFVRHPEARFYDRLLLLLASRGHIKPSHQTPREFAMELAAEHPDFDELPTYTEWYYRAQYAGRGLQPEQWQRIKATLARLREDTAFGEN